MCFSCLSAFLSTSLSMLYPSVCPSFFVSPLLHRKRSQQAAQDSNVVELLNVVAAALIAEGTPPKAQVALSTTILKVMMMKYGWMKGWMNAAAADDDFVVDVDDDGQLCTGAMIFSF